MAPTTKRTDYLSWEEYFMAMALLAAHRSKDPNTQVGACIVGPDNNILGTGYNGFPRGCSDDDFPWERDGDLAATKYAYVVHAEQNAICNANRQDLKGARLYVGLHPCHECARQIIQEGIREVVFLSDKYAAADSTIAAKRMFAAAGVVTRQFVSHNPLLETLWLGPRPE